MTGWIEKLGVAGEHLNLCTFFYLSKEQFDEKQNKN